MVIFFVFFFKFLRFVQFVNFFLAYRRFFPPTKLAKNNLRAASFHLLSLPSSSIYIQLFYGLCNVLLVSSYLQHFHFDHLQPHRFLLRTRTAAGLIVKGAATLVGLINIVSIFINNETNVTIVPFVAHSFMMVSQMCVPSASCRFQLTLRNGPSVSYPNLPSSGVKDFTNTAVYPLFHAKNISMSANQLTKATSPVDLKLF